MTDHVTRRGATSTAGCAAGRDGLGGVGSTHGYQCPEFPCDKADFEPLLKAKWLKANRRMQKIGPVAYFEEAKGRSHYV